MPLSSYTRNYEQTKSLIYDIEAIMHKLACLPSCMPTILDSAALDPSRTMQFQQKLTIVLPMIRTYIEDSKQAIIAGDINAPDVTKPSGPILRSASAPLDSRPYSPRPRINRSRSVTFVGFRNFEVSETQVTNSNQEIRPKSETPNLELDGDYSSASTTSPSVALQQDEYMYFNFEIGQILALGKAFTTDHQIMKLIDGSYNTTEEFRENYSSDIWTAPRIRLLVILLYIKYTLDSSNQMELAGYYKYSSHINTVEKLQAQDIELLEQLSNFAKSFDIMPDTIHTEVEELLHKLRARVNPQYVRPVVVTESESPHAGLEAFALNEATTDENDSVSCDAEPMCWSFMSYVSSFFTSAQPETAQKPAQSPRSNRPRADTI